MAKSSLLVLLLLTTVILADRVGDYEYRYSLNREQLHQQERVYAGYRFNYTEVCYKILLPGLEICWFVRPFYQR